ncbi:MAG: AMP-binding protein [Clostridia bacterium]|nr:AMP-binding protein [Clostridia bacterium]
MKEATIKPIVSIKGMLADAVAEAGEQVAYKYRAGEEIREVTFRAFREDTLSLGEALCQLGVVGEHIAMSGENSYPWITVYLTVLQGNGVFVPIDRDLPEDDFLNVLRNSDATVLFYTKKHEELIRRRLAELSHIRYFIGIDCIEESERFLSFDRLLSSGYDLREAGLHRFEELARDPHKLAMLVYTSGTTGHAKGVMLSEHNLCSSVYYGLHCCTPGRVGLSVLPYHHTYEAVPGLLVAIHHHSTLCLNENLRTVSANLNLYKPDYMYVVPAYLEAFYKKIWATVEKQGKKTAFSALIKLSNGLRKIGIDRRRSLFKTVHASFGGNLVQFVCGGAPIRRELAVFFDAIGIEVFNGYGITECSPLVSVNMRDNNDPTTVGIPLPCCEIRLDGETEDGDGEICVRGDVVMMGYYKNEAATAEVLTEDGWFYTGDYGHMTEKGQLVITGRKKNLIVLSNGKNVFPEEIEAYLQRIPYVAEVVIFGLRDKNGQEEALGAEVYLQEEVLSKMGITNPEEALKKDGAHVCAPLPAYKHIAKYYIRKTEFEKTTSRKIKRSGLIFASK